MTAVLVVAIVVGGVTFLGPIARDVTFASHASTTPSTTSRPLVPSEDSSEITAILARGGAADRARTPAQPYQRPIQGTWPR